MKSKKTISTTSPKKSTPKVTKSPASNKTPATNNSQRNIQNNTRITLKAKAPQFTTEDIQTRAYFLSLERGGSPVENWTIAEAEFKAGLWT